uniref:Protein tyrosine phosphatase type IVA 3 n=1 Tax=Ciona intestinalis TaxID=7719 RepID=A0A1W3JGN6_CIOIN|nr:protein tyrosine phosphatase type IVA 3 [Ciona intestinalis]XP_009860852.1 protein tyrosine phosphatase type IVA 3 [Ciona intestinalis]XP_026693418.1 protein tyrosine phosphatase type IVA 3 [Ciona intestinalis]|eukprot:XP_002129243.1 protein tyrosine phosphatase type IVA 3 [Ciona intestinalis]
MARMNRPAPVEVRHKGMRFLITHNPTNSTMEKFLEILNQYEADTVVRVCESTYDKEQLTAKGIQVMDWAFDDGAAPPKDVVEDWLKLLKAHLKRSPQTCIAVHCVAGLGRAPVLVALALMESGMKYEDAVEFIRQKRRGAINSKQLQYLEKYRPKYCLRMRENGKPAGCSIQ